MFRLTTTTTRKVGFSRGRVSTRSSEATTITGSRSEATWSEAAGRSSRFSSFRDSRPKTRCFSQSRHLQLSVSFIHFFGGTLILFSWQTYIFFLSYLVISQPLLKSTFPCWLEHSNYLFCAIRWSKWMVYEKQSAQWGVWTQDLSEF